MGFPNGVFLDKLKSANIKMKSVLEIRAAIGQFMI